MPPALQPDDHHRCHCLTCHRRRWQSAVLEAVDGIYHIDPTQASSLDGMVLVYPVQDTIPQAGPFLENMPCALVIEWEVHSHMLNQELQAADTAPVAEQAPH